MRKAFLEQLLLGIVQNNESLIADTYAHYSKYNVMDHNVGFIMACYLNKLNIANIIYSQGNISTINYVNGNRMMELYGSEKKIHRDTSRIVDLRSSL